MYLRIGNIDIPIASGSVSWEQNSAADIRVTVPAAMFDWKSSRFKDIELWRRGQKIVTGFVYDSPTLGLDNDKVQMVTLGCLDDVGRLACKRAKSTAHYQDSPLTSIVQDLLLLAGDWVLSDTSTMVDQLAKTTVDLRSKEHLWPQIVEAVKSIPNCFVRYGGYNEAISRHQLELGYFNREASLFLQGQDNLEIQLQKSSQISYTTLEGYGGRTSTVKVSLYDALSYPGILTHPDFATYPIQLDLANGTYVVRDLTTGKQGCEITKTFQVNKTKNDGAPLATEIYEAGFAVWQNCVRFLKQNTEYQTYAVEVLQGSIPQVGDRSWLQGQVTEPIRDNPLSDSITWHPTFSVADSFRITRVELDMTQSAVIVDPLSEQLIAVDGYKVELSSNDYAEQIDDQTELYSRLERYDENDDIPRTLGVLFQQIVTVTQLTTDPADATCLPSVAKSFEFAFSPPAAAAQLFYTILPAPVGVTYVIDQAPALPDVPLILCVQVLGTWPGASDVTLSVQFTFS